MPSSYVFPGGARDPDEDDLRITAARELFEEAGVLLVENSQDVPDEITLDSWRDQLYAGDISFSDLLKNQGLKLDLDLLRPYSHWITPSIERKRFSARFFVAESPREQVARHDHRETVDAVWLTAQEALAQSAELHLMPPQLRTFVDLEALTHSVDALYLLADQFSNPPATILPKALAEKGTSFGEPGFALLLPWDPEYELGMGEGLAVPAEHPQAQGPSRFVVNEGVWQHIDA